MEARHRKTWILLSLAALLLVAGGLVGVSVARYADNAALARAIKTGDAPLAHRLLRRGADPRTLSNDGGNLLTLAARTNDVRLLKEGLARGLAVETVDLHGLTPLMWASLCGWEECAAVLLQAGANPRRRSPDGLTPLNCSTLRGFSLIEGTRLTFSQPAAHPGFARVERLLKQHGAQ